LFDQSRKIEIESEPNVVAQAERGGEIVVYLPVVQKHLRVERRGERPKGKIILYAAGKHADGRGPQPRFHQARAFGSQLEREDAVVRRRDRRGMRVQKIVNELVAFRMG